MRRRGRPPHPDLLTPREWEVLALVRDGLTNDEIAARLAVSPSTAKFHVSEILGKLGLTSRDEAARWRPPDDGHARLDALLAPLAPLRRLHWPLQLAGAAVVLAAVAGVGTLVWGVRASGGSGSDRITIPRHVCSGPQQPGGGTPMVIGVVDARTGDCHVVPIADRVMRAQWVEDGKTLVAYDVDKKAFEIFDLEGRAVQPIYFPVPSTQDNGIYAAISPSPDGKALLIERNVLHTLTLRDVVTGQERDIPKWDGIDAQASFSPDGTHVAYVNLNNGKLSLVLARIPLESGISAMVRTVNDSTDYLTPLEWSPDGKYLLIMTGKLAAPCVGAPDPACRQLATQTWEVVDVAADGRSAWLSQTQRDDANDWRVTSVQWAGADRLLLGQPEVRAKDGADLPAQARFIELSSGTATPAEPALANVTSVSPDGRFGANGNRLVDLASLRETRVADYDAAYYYDWTADSKLGLYSFDGN